MWEDRVEHRDEYTIVRGYRPYLQFEDDLWDEILRKMAEAIEQVGAVIRSRM
jgi:hypothetical protein